MKSGVFLLYFPAMNKKKRPHREPLPFVIFWPFDLRLPEALFAAIYLHFDTRFGRIGRNDAAGISPDDMSDVIF